MHGLRKFVMHYVIANIASWINGCLFSISCIRDESRRSVLFEVSFYLRSWYVVNCI